MTFPNIKKTKWGDTPEPGFFKTRLAKGGSWVGAAIYLPCPIDPYYGEQLDRARHLMAHINGEECEASNLWVYGHFVSRSEYLFLMADRAWAKKYAPESPEANPRSKINIKDIAPSKPTPSQSVNIRDLAPVTPS